MHLKPDLVNTILNQIDARTFVQTAKLILNGIPQVTFHPKPHLLIMNPNDKTLDYARTVTAFRAHVTRLIILKTDLPHFPSNLSYSYFAEKIPPNQLEIALRELAKMI